jgi:hypothetical protein
MVDSGVRAHQIRILAAVAGHLTSALDTLALGGVGCVTIDLLELLAFVEGMIAVLENSDVGLPSSSLGLLLAHRLHGSS